MKYCKISSLFILFNFLCYQSFSQPFIKNSFRSPIGIPILLSGNFGELRSNHFHSGLDIKTNGTINYRIYAIEDGFISRINISHWGYGKAIYVDHPNGYTSVYAHLNHFPAKIEKLIRSFQYESFSESINYYPDSGLIQVKKGEVIAYSGNSGGSSGPHLHFEIRDTKSEHPLNPQLFGFEIKDDRPPVINRLKIYSLGNTIINESCQDKEFSLVKKNAKYTLRNDSIIKIKGKFGVGLSTVDYYNKTYNKCGIYSIQVWLDDQLYFDQKINELNFETTRQINVYKDFEAYKNKRESIHKAYIHPANELLFYDYNLGDGTFEFNDDNLHKISIKVSDIKNNHCFLDFYVKQSIDDKCKEDQPSISFDSIVKPLVSKDSNCVVYLDATSLYDHQEINVNFDEKNILHLGSEDIAVQESFAIALKIKKPSEIYSNQLLLAHIDEKGKIKNRKGDVENGWVKANINHFGDFKLMVDSTPPLIKAIYQPQKVKLNEVLKFKVSDDLSGVESYEVKFNGEWILSNYNYKTAQLSIPLNHYTSLETKDYSCVITVEDERNNSSKYSFDISIADN